MAKQKKVWLVKHPTHQYEEDVKELAAANRLTILDAKFKGLVDKSFLTDKAPKLTKKPAKKKATKE